MKILVIDDSKQFTCSGWQVKKNNFKPTMVNSAKNAIILLNNENFDGITSDVEMPEMNGF